VPLRVLLCGTAPVPCPVPLPVLLGGTAPVPCPVPLPVLLCGTAPVPCHMHLRACTLARLSCPSVNPTQEGGD